MHERKSEINCNFVVVFFHENVKSRKKGEILHIKAQKREVLKRKRIIKEKQTKNRCAVYHLVVFLDIYMKRNEEDQI